MKSLQFIACLLSVSLVAAVQAATAPEVQELLTKGQTAYMAGDLETAKSAFQMAYEIDSRNTVAIGFLRRIKADEMSKPKPVDMAKQLAGIVIPNIQVKEATLGSALDYMKKAIEKQTAGKRAVNFVVQLPAEQVNTQTVTLSLTNVPFTEALTYLGTVAGLDFVYDKYAIIVKPKVAPAPVAPTATTTPAGPSSTTATLPGAQ
jgi:hypothetical protein